MEIEKASRVGLAFGVFCSFMSFSGLRARVWGGRAGI